MSEEKMPKEKGIVSEKKEQKPATKSGSGEKLAVIRLAGEINLSSEVKDTLHMLRLRKKHSCVIIEKTPSNEGMIKRVKDFVTWGEIDDATLKMLVDKRAEINPADPKKTKPFFRLSPPVKGFGRKGTKAHFNVGGALGYRGKKINDLLKRMI